MIPRNVQNILLKSVVALSLLGLSGCYKVTIRPTAAPVPDVAPQFSETQDFFVFGLIGEKHIDVGAVCRGEPVQMQTKHTFLNQLIGLLTIGIYTPATANIWCS